MNPWFVLGVAAAEELGVERVAAGADQEHGKKSEEKNQKVEPKQDRLGYRSATSLPAQKEFH